MSGEAQVDLDLLQAQLDLFPVVEVRARNTDPVTSYEAASSVERVRATQALVLRLLKEHGPMSDEQVATTWATRAFPAVSSSGLRTRRHELVDLGLVEDSGQKVVMASGRRAIVWAAK